MCQRLAMHDAQAGVAGMVQIPSAQTGIFSADDCVGADKTKKGRSLGSARFF